MNIPKTILLIDDEPDMRMVIQDILEEGGHSIIESGDGEEALQMMQKSRPALVICDLSMPKMDGFQVLKQIQELGLMCAVVMLTAHVEQEKIDRSFGLGAIAYVTKPFDPDRLLKQIDLLYPIGEEIRSILDLPKQLQLIASYRLGNPDSVMK